MGGFSIAPIPFNIHVGFAIIASVFFFIQYYRKGFLYYIALAVGAPLTLLVHVSNNHIFITILGLIELAIMIFVFASMINIKIKSKNSKIINDTLVSDASNEEEISNGVEDEDSNS